MVAMSHLELVLSESQLAEGVERLGRQIQVDYQGRPLLVLGVLQGSFILMADLVRRLDLPLTIDFVRLSSYGSSTTSSGQVDFISPILSPLEGRHVLVVEDIVDTGRTTSALVSYLGERGVASTRVCALLDKPQRRDVDIAIDYKGFEVPDRFLVGYGLDFDGRYRQLPALYALEDP